MRAYKLFRVLATGEITPLFINKTKRLPIGVMMPAEDHPTKGFAHRPHWHYCSTPEAPHLSMKKRAWYEVEIKDYKEFKRPEIQGGTWYLANQMIIIKRVGE